MKNLGKFVSYTPDAANPHKIRFWKNEDGVDWYSLREEKGIAFVGVCDATVTTISDDITMIAPDDMMIFVMGEGDAVPELGWRFEDGAFTEPAPDNTSILRPITPLQLRLALRGLGLRDKVTEVIAAVEDPDLRGTMEDAFEYATEYDPASPLTQQMAEFFIGHPDTPLDEASFWDMWRTAQDISA